MRSQRYETTPKDGYLLERGPRSFMYRESDDSCEDTLQLFRQLQLGEEVIFADTNAAKRFVWNGGANGKVVQLPSGLMSFWKSPFRSAILRGLKHDYDTPPLLNTDESVWDWANRRFNSTLADELVDPMIAGIYAGDPKKLSIVSCLHRLTVMEARSGGVVRDMFFPPAEVKAAKKAKTLERFDKSLERVEDEEWMTQAKRSSIYSLKGGVSRLTTALRQRLESDHHDPYAKVLPGKDADVKIALQQSVMGLRIDESNKPILQLVDKEGVKTESAYDHVFSTLPSFALQPIIGASQLPLSSQHHTQLSNLLNESSMPFASIWLVNIVYDHEVLPPEKRGFGLLVPTKHNIPGLEILGITYDSVVFPAQNSSPRETRFTVMIGGDRFPQYSSASRESMELHALKAVQAMLDIDPREHRPIIVNGMFQGKCIPQYYVGHAAKVNQALQLFQHIASTPSSHKLPESIKVPTIDVPQHAAAAAGTTPHHRPITLLGTSFCGVSLNDCIHHGMAAAQDFVKREIEAAKRKN